MNSPNPTKKFGTTMTFLACLVLLGLLTLFFADQEEKNYNPNQSPETQQDATVNTVVLQRNRFTHYVTSGFINSTPVVFLLDTGATAVVIPEQIAEQLKLKRGAPHLAATANGTITVYHTQLQELSIGSITLNNVRASINPAMHGEEILLGMSALKNIEFTQRGDQLTLKQYR